MHIYCTWYRFTAWIILSILAVVNFLGGEMVEDVEFLLAVFFSGCGDLIELPLLTYCEAMFCFSCIMIVNDFYVCMHACMYYVCTARSSNERTTRPRSSKHVEHSLLLASVSLIRRTVLAFCIDFS